MKILILSDLHIEFADIEINYSNADAVILAGDINIGLKGINWIIEKFKNISVFYVLGNHEYYSNKYPKLLKAVSEKTKNTNVQLLENNFILMGSICIHGATLWTDFSIFGDSRIAGYECQERMTDFKRIRIEPGYSKIRYTDILSIHKESLWILGNNLKLNKDKYNIVISHHAPSIKSVPEEFKEDIITASYASDLERFIEDNKPNLWVHGHIHSSSDYYLNNCRVVCNPKGYPDEINKNFRTDFIIEV